jgi:hypothetical protein
MSERKKVVVVADTHCGHRVGLTPPEYQASLKPDKYTAIREELWDLYIQMIEKQKPIHILLANGDLLDGTAWRSSGTESLTTDMSVQVEIAQECLRVAKANHIILTYGTGYHTAPDGQDYDKMLTDKMASDYSMHLKTCKIGAEEWVNVNGLCLNIKHFTGRSSIPHGRGTGISRDRLWGILWADRGNCPRADVIIRSHVHYDFQCGEHDWLAMTTPALMGLGSKFGSRIPSETVSFGITWFDIMNREDWSWGWDIVLGETQKTKAIDL